MFLSILVLSLSVVTQSENAEQKSTVNVAPGVNESVIDEKTGRSPLLDSIFNVSSDIKKLLLHKSLFS